MSSWQRCLGQLLLKQTGDHWGSQWGSNCGWWGGCTEAGLLLVHYESISPVLVKRGSRQRPWRLEGALSDRLRLEGWWLPLNLSFLLIKVHTMGGPLADGWQWLSPGFPARPRVTPGLAWQLLSSAAFTNFQVPGKVDCYSLAFQTLSVGSKKNIWINIMPHLLYGFVICILFCSKVLCFHCVFPWKSNFVIIKNT